MRLLLSLIFSTAILIAVGQQPIVEVTVSDTVQLEPDQILYLVSLNNDDVAIDSIETAVDTLPVRRLPAPPNPSLAAVRRIVAEMKLDTVADFDYTFSNGRYKMPSQTIPLWFTSTDRLRTFIDRIRQLENVSGAIAQMTSVGEEAGLRLLYQRLLKKAKTQAEMLAQQAGRKLGVVLSVRELSAEEGGGWTMCPPLSTIPGWHTPIGRVQAGEKVVLTKRLSVQFGW